MIKCYVIALAFFSLLLAGCEQQPAAPAGGQPSSSSTPAPSTAPATPTSTALTPGPQATPESTASPTPTVTPEATATPESTTAPAPTATPVLTTTPEITPTASPESSATPETTPTASTPSPGVTPDAVAPSPSSSPSASESDVRPTLSSRSANEYLQSYDDYVTDLKSASKAMKEGDMTKYQTVIQRAHELQTKSEKLGGELNPEEEQRFANYLNKKANELAQFASQNR